MGLPWSIGCFRLRDDSCQSGFVLARDDGVRRRMWLTIIVVMVLAVVPAAATLPAALTMSTAILEPGSLLVLGIAFLILAAVARRLLSS